MDPPNEIEGWHGTTPLLLTAYFAFFSIFAFFGFMVLFFQKHETEVYVFVAAVIGITVLFSFAAYLLKLFVELIHRFFKTERFTSLKFNMTIGLSLIILLSSPVRILVYFMELDDDSSFYVSIYTFVIFPVTSASIWRLFNFPSAKIWDFTGEKHANLCFLIFALLFLTFVPIRIAVSPMYPENGSTALINTIQIFLGIITIAPIVELAFILVGGVELHKKEKKRMEEEKMTLEGNGVMLKIAKVVESDPKLECKICLLQYTETSRIPRILSNCGHTICEECANNLLMKNNKIHLFCPLCQTATVVKGNATWLAKNFLVLDYMKKMETDIR